jgi:endonuclease/exonuclease/phosphatase family metal-dependent hydrolase
MRVIRVMSFNIWNTGEPDPWEENLRAAWSRRRPWVVHTIHRVRPALIGFQEFSPFHWESLRDDLPYAACPDFESDEFGNTILYRADRFGLLDSGLFWLSRTPDEPIPQWDLPYAVGVRWAILENLESKTPLLCLNTQYEDGWAPNQVQMREEGSRILVGQIERISQDWPDAPVILTGDFNCNAWDVPYRVFIEHGFVDTYRAAGHGDSTESSTYHGYMGEAYSGLEWGDEQCWRVDWILTRDGKQRLQTVASTILRDGQPPIYPSDHRPVIADLYVVD